MRGLITQIFTAASLAGFAEAAPWVRVGDGWRGDLYGQYGFARRLGRHSNGRVSNLSRLRSL
jgi:hypothetical protein